MLGGKFQRNDELLCICDLKAAANNECHQARAGYGNLKSLATLSWVAQNHYGSLNTKVWAFTQTQAGNSAGEEGFERALRPISVEA